MAAPDPRVQQLYMTPATRAAYGEDTFRNLPTQAGYPPQGIPTVFITRQDLARHYPGELPSNFSALDPMARAALGQAFMDAYRETGAPLSLMGNKPQQFVDNAIERVGEGFVHDSPMAGHAANLGGTAAVVSLPSKPQSFATTFSDVSGIPLNRLPQLGTLGNLSDRYTQIIHEVRHLVQDPEGEVLARERDADMAANQAHPGFANLMQDARRFGAVHNAIRGNTVEHAGPFIDAMGRQSFAQPSYGQLNRVFFTVGAIALNEYAQQRYASGMPNYPVEGGVLGVLIERRLEQGGITQAERTALEAAQQQLHLGKSGPEVMDQLRQTGPDGRVTYVANMRQYYQMTQLGEELVAQGPQAVGPLLHAAMSRVPSPTDSMPPERAAMVREAAGQYLEASGHHYPELQRYAVLPAPNQTAETKPGIVMPKMAMLEPLNTSEAAPEEPAAKSAVTFAPRSLKAASLPRPE